MRAHLLLLLSCAFGLLASANADPNNLEGGVFITHAASPECLEWIGYYGGDPCAAWEDGTAPCAIGICEEQVNWLPTGGYPDMNLFWVLAAWGEEKVWCGVEFGISPAFNELWYFSQWGSCGPEVLELPTGEWPGAGEGIAIATTGDPWEGNFQPVYFFAGYSYEESLIELDVDPTTDFAGFANCEVPSQMWDAECLGAMGIGDGAQGTDCCPLEIPLGACCFEDGSCADLPESDCDAIGGLFLGELIPCEPENPCEQPIRACCLVTGECILLLPEDCADLGGDWHFEWDTCHPNPCPTPATDASWGSIKVLYR